MYTFTKRYKNVRFSKHIDTLSCKFSRESEDLDDFNEGSYEIFLFGDNLMRKGKGGQAVIRDEPNAVGIPTKNAPSRNDSAYFSDDNYEDNIRHISNAFISIPHYATVVMPKNGLGTGLAKLKEKAPRTFAYLDDIYQQFYSHTVDSPDWKWSPEVTINFKTPVLRVIIAGSRTIEDSSAISDLIEYFLERKERKNIIILTGMAKGVDRIAYNFAKHWGIEVEEYPANWETHGKSAGYQRNLRMAYNANALLAFWDGYSKGTTHMINIANEKGLEVRTKFVGVGAGAIEPKKVCVINESDC